MKNARTYLLLLPIAFSAISLSQTRIKDAILNHSETQEVRADPVSYQQAEPLSYKSVALAVALSTIVPGAGELYAGNFENGKYALMAEAAIWVTYTALYTHGNWVRNDARLFASEHAGASFNSKGNKFDVDIGNYLSMNEYNHAKLRNRELDLLYTDPSYQWQWDTDADRTAFKNARIRSDEIYQNAKFVIAAAVVNRIFSAFSAGRAASAYNRKVLIEGAWNLEAYPTHARTYADGIAMQLSLDF